MKKPIVTVFPNGTVRRDYGDMVTESSPAPFTLKAHTLLDLHCATIGTASLHVFPPNELTCQCGELRSEEER